MQPTLEKDIATIDKISAVPTILEAVSELTGLRLICIARVTPDSWHACAVLDRMAYGLQKGDALDVSTTLCGEVCATNAPIIIDSVRESARYRDHQTPRIYGFDSYFSVPLHRPGGEYFGTLFGLDREKHLLSDSATRNTLTLFAELISRQLASEVVLSDARAALSDEKETAKLREQFIAMLGHDIRTPLSTIANGTEILRLKAPPALTPLLDIMHRSTQRIAVLLDDVTDFARGRMGGGISLNLRHEPNLQLLLQQAVDELRKVHPERAIVAELPDQLSLLCDGARMVQLLSNLLKNAIVHGSQATPVQVQARLANGIFELAVSNSGAPIPEEIQAKLFKPFWQSAGGNSQGLGLGLFIASEIAVSHGGTLEVASTGSSTTFTYRCRTADFVDRRATPRL